VRLSPVLSRMGTYPFVRLSAARAAAEAGGVDVIDFGMGEPREKTPAFIRRALVEALEAEPVSSYPKAEGLSEVREAIAAWTQRRFGAQLDPDTEVVPTLGSKEVVFGLAQIVGGPGAKIGVPSPGYPVPERGAAFAGAEIVEVPLVAENGWLPDLDVLPGDLALLWLNYPNNPTGARAPLEFYERAQRLALARGFVVASDEAYSELWFAGDPPHSALELADRRNLLVLNTLSKRSSMPGYRAGFAAGDPELIAALKKYRPNAGVTPQTFVQHAAAAAWSDEEHVEAVRERYREKRAALLPALLELGLEPAGGDATFFLWMRTPDTTDDEAFASALLADHGIVVAPGCYLGAGGAGHVRVALVPTLDRCREAASRVQTSRRSPRV